MRGRLSEAARLAKTDLTTELVKEFTELQGVVGGMYARAQGVQRDGWRRRSMTSTGRRGWRMGCLGRWRGRCSVMADKDGYDCGDVRSGDGADGVEGSVCAAACGEWGGEDPGRVARLAAGAAGGSGRSGHGGSSGAGCERLIGRSLRSGWSSTCVRRRGQAYDVGEGG